MNENKSKFASSVRSSTEEIFNENEIVGTQKFFTELFGAITGIGAVVDRNRQIVYANDEFLSMLGIDSVVSILGKRPGEAVSCVHSAEEPAGCGTSRACAYCGAVNAILESQRTGKKATRETRISTLLDGKHKSWDMNLISTPVTFNGNVLYVIILQDISDTKRTVALERIFFHDLLNSVGGLYGLLTVLKEETNPEQTRELINLSEEASRNIIEEILLQRQIRAAENGELNVSLELTNSLELLDSAIAKIGYHESGKEIKILKSPNSLNADFETDKVLLQRVMINLLKNALEATTLPGSILTGVTGDENKITFWVKNDQVMTEEVQAQLFQRSFSTKGSDRGLGTYSIRLLTENYLRGNVSFVSNETEGTVFTVELNREFPSKN